MENISISNKYIVCCFSNGRTYNKKYNSIIESQDIIEFMRNLGYKCWIIYPTHH